MKLRLLTGPRAGRQLRVSDTKPVSIGRRVGRLRLHDSRVSKHHARITFENATWVLRDLGSSNGTYLNQSEIDGLAELETGDLIQMGRVLVKVLRADDIGMDTLPASDEDNDATAEEIAFLAAGIRPSTITSDQDGPGSEVGEEPDLDDIDLELLLGGNDAEDDEDAFQDFLEADQESHSEAGEAADQRHLASDPPEPFTEVADEEADQSSVGEADSGGFDLDTGEEPEPQLDTVGDDLADFHVDPAITSDDEVQDAFVAEEPLPPLGLDDEPVRIPDEQTSEADHGDPGESTASDLISIDDNSEDNPRPGTTVVASVTEDPPSAFEPEDEDDDEQEDDPPLIVGLRLDQQAPQQPEPEVSAGEVDLTAEIDDTTQEITPPDKPAWPGETTAADRLDETLDPFDSVSLDKANLELADEFVGDAEVRVDDEQDRGYEGSLNNPVGLSDDEKEDLENHVLETTSEFEEEQADKQNEQADEQQSLPITDSLGEAEPNEADEPNVDEPHGASEAQMPLAGNAGHGDDAVVEQEDHLLAGQRAALPDQDSFPTDDASGEEASTEPEDTEPDEQAFDIDAAFVALSEGLDDSFELPAIDPAGPGDAVDLTDVPSQADRPDVVSVSGGADISAAPDAEPHRESPKDEAQHVVPEAEAEDQPEDERAIEPSPEAIPGPLAGSQLDVGFIQDALAKLESNTDEDHLATDAIASPEAAGETSDNGNPLLQDGSTEDASVQQPGDEGQDVTDVAQPIEPAFQNPPPGINPTSMGEPIEGSLRKKKAKRKRWFFTSLVFLALAGVGGYLLYNQMVGNEIAGRPIIDIRERAKQKEDAGVHASATQPNANAQASVPLPSESADPLASPPPSGLSEPKPRTGPDPFAAGPAITGGKSLKGIAFGSTPPASQSPDSSAPPVATDSKPTIESTPPLTAEQAPPSPAPSAEPAPVSALPLPPPPDPAAAVDRETRIVFLIDASGSLIDSMPQMLAWVRSALKTVGPDEKFAVVFFKAGRAIEIAPAGMIKPTREMLADISNAWLNPDAAPLIPSGRSNPEAGIAKALSYKPTDVYLLSNDSFARTSSDATVEDAIGLVAEAFGQAQVRVHGVQFFYRNGKSTLESLAEKYDGTFEFVKEQVASDGEPIDLLRELESAKE